MRTARGVLVSTLVCGFTYAVLRFAPFSLAPALFSLYGSFEAELRAQGRMFAHLHTKDTVEVVRAEYAEEGQGSQKR